MFSEAAPDAAALGATGNLFNWYRAHIAGGLATVTNLKAPDILSAVQRSQKLDKGDCILGVPALRIKGKKPVEIANSIRENVLSCSAIHYRSCANF